MAISHTTTKTDLVRIGKKDHHKLPLCNNTFEFQTNKTTRWQQFQHFVPLWTALVSAANLLTISLTRKASTRSKRSLSSQPRASPTCWRLFVTEDTKSFTQMMHPEPSLNWIPRIQYRWRELQTFGVLLAPHGEDFSHCHDVTNWKSDS